jgi:four helix bundle protein
MTRKLYENYDLEDRLIQFGITIIKMTEKIPNSRAGNVLGGQIVRSCTSPALNYGEAQAAESRKDFIHKFKIILKELRETKVCLKLIKGSGLVKNENLINISEKENDELIAIFVKSIDTAQSKS